MSNTDFGQENGASKAGSLKDTALDAAKGVKQEAASFAAEAQDHLSEQLDDRKDEALRSLHVFADAIRKAGDELSRNDQSVAGQLVKQAAEGLEGLSRSVSDKSPEDLLAAVRQFGRENPVAFAGAAALLGVALGRVARSSAPEAASAGARAPGGKSFSSSSGSSAAPGSTASTSGFGVAASSDTSGSGQGVASAGAATGVVSQASSRMSDGDQGNAGPGETGSGSTTPGYGATSGFSRGV